jgi:hypothetical protein
MRKLTESLILTGVAAAIVTLTHLPYAPVAAFVAAVYVNTKEIIR